MGQFLFISFYTLAMLVSATTSLTSDSSFGDALSSLNPTMNATGSEMVLSTNNTLSLRCVGRSSICWFYEQRPLSEANFGVRLTTWNNTTPLLIHESSMQLVNLTYSDTGDFSCQYQHNTYNTNSSVYVYVYDGATLLLNLKSIFLLIENKPGVLPCRATHPNITVKLMQRVPGFRGMTTLVDGDDNLLYDSRRGFLIRRVTSLYSAEVRCVASMDDKQTERVPHTIYKSATTPGSLQVVVKPNRTEMLVGTSMFLSCLVDITSNREVLLMLSWVHPTDKDLNRTVITPAVKLNGLIHGKLFIEHVTMSDSGFYKCVIRTHDDVIETGTALVIVHGNPFINLSADLEFTVKAGEDLRLPVNISAFPHLPSLSWFKEGQPLPLQVQNRRSNRVYRERYDILRIRQAQPSDAGLYQLVASNAGVNGSITMKVTVNEAPTVTIIEKTNSPHRSIVTVNHNHSLTCISSGNPQPQVYWQWQACSSNCETPAADRWTPVVSSKNIPYARARINNESILTINAQESGFYSCTAENELGVESESIQFIVTDIAGGFGIRISSQINVLEGFDINITCLANDLMYKNNSLQWHTDESKHSALINRAGLNIAATRTSYSNGSQLQFVNIQFADAGVYICKVTDNKEHFATAVIKVVTVCGGSITINETENVTIKSPDYDIPGYYNNSQECSWQISGPPDRELSLQFVNAFGFICSTHQGCLWHWVEVKYKRGLDLEGVRFCCYVLPDVNITSESSEMLVIFKTKLGQYQARGLHAAVSVGELLTTTATSTSSTSVTASTSSPTPTTTTTTDTTTATPIPMSSPFTVSTPTVTPTSTSTSTSASTSTPTSPSPSTRTSTSTTTTTTRPSTLSPLSVTPTPPLMSSSPATESNQTTTSRSGAAECTMSYAFHSTLICVHLFAQLFLLNML